jgi:hypothetical protein
MRRFPMLLPATLLPGQWRVDEILHAEIVVTINNNVAMVMQ